MGSLRRPALGGGWAEAETPAYAFPESFPLLRSHALHAFGHAVGHSIGRVAAELGAMATVPSKSAEEYPAQHQYSKRLPEGNLAPAKQRRQQPIPQLLHYFAPEGDKSRECQNRQRSQPNPSLSHVQFLMFS
jgi:hypothetical protein